MLRSARCGRLSWYNSTGTNGGSDALRSLRLGRQTRMFHGVLYVHFESTILPYAVKNRTRNVASVFAAAV